MQREPATAESPLRVFGAMLRHYRTAAGLTPEDLGARIYLSASQIRKVEDGTRTPSEALTQACESLPELNTHGALTTLREILKDHLRQRAYPGWFQAWPDHESHARRLRSFQLVVVPGLLQIESYARAVLSTRVGATAEELDEAVAARLERQRILDNERPPELWVLLDEAVLRRPVGGPEVMADQLEYLAAAAQRPHIALQIIPLAAGAHEGMRGGAFVLADFNDNPSLGYQDTAVTGQIVEEANQVEALALTWDTLRLEALPRSASLQLVEEVAQTWKRRNQ
ncbi:MAG TPA: helix-turn-helix transcriptional regulator [Trebonia sp.]|jgi:transcriptional regulator with XRE-family HTH domain|nr:helix-turn-helix transcriptional regulator [Trebonia sp.]